MTEISSPAAPKLTPIFVGGTGRSGTTIFYNLLRKHPRLIGLTRELRVHIDPDGALDLIDALSDDWSPYRADLAISHFYRLMKAVSRTSPVKLRLAQGLRRAHISAPRYAIHGHATEFGDAYFFERLNRFRDSLVYHVTEGSWYGSDPLRWRSTIYETEPLTRPEASQRVSALFDDLYRNMAKNGETHWGDSTPYNILHADRLAEIFPNARIIHIYRDPRDVVASHRQQSWGGDELVMIARRLSIIYERWFAIRERLPANSYLEVGLEAFTENPEATMESVMDFLALPKEALPYDMISRKKAHTARWKTELPADAIDAMTRYLSPYIVKFGYAL